MHRFLRLFAAMPFIFALTAGGALAQYGGGAPTNVVVYDVTKIHFVDEVEALGTLKANESVDLTSTVTEMITAINFEDGQFVTKGTLLAEMDAAEELAELAEEQSTLEEAKAQLARIEPLVRQRAASESLLDERKREVRTAEARVKAVESRLAQRHVTAPFDGIVGLRQISVGALAQPGTLITTIDDITKMKLDFSVPAIFLSTLEPGVQINARARAFPEREFTGTIASVDSRVDPVTRSLQVRAIIDNNDGTLKPGLLMRVELEKNPRQAVVVPEEALIPDGSQYYVYVAVDGTGENAGKTTAARRDVTIGSRRAGVVEITSGLETNDRLITHGGMKLRPNAPITIGAVQKPGDNVSDLLDKLNQNKANNTAK